MYYDIYCMSLNKMKEVDLIQKTKHRFCCNASLTFHTNISHVNNDLLLKVQNISGYQIHQRIDIMHTVALIIWQFLLRIMGKHPLPSFIKDGQSVLEKRLNEALKLLSFAFSEIEQLFSQVTFGFLRVILLQKDYLNEISDRNLYLKALHELKQTKSQFPSKFSENQPANTAL